MGVNAVHNLVRDSVGSVPVFPTPVLRHAAPRVRPTEFVQQLDLLAADAEDPDKCDDAHSLPFSVCCRQIVPARERPLGPSAELESLPSEFDPAEVDQRPHVEFLLHSLQLMEFSPDLRSAVPRDVAEALERAPTRCFLRDWHSAAAVPLPLGRIRNPPFRGAGSSCFRSSPLDDGISYCVSKSYTRNSLGADTFPFFLRLLLFLGLRALPLLLLMLLLLLLLLLLLPLLLLVLLLILLLLLPMLPLPSVLGLFVPMMLLEVVPWLLLLFRLWRLLAASFSARGPRT
jgi:hypothetical protein